MHSTYTHMQYKIYNEHIKARLTVAVRALRTLSIRQPSTGYTAAGQSGRESINRITTAIERGQTRFCIVSVSVVLCVYWPTIATLWQCINYSLLPVANPGKRKGGGFKLTNECAARILGVTPTFGPTHTRENPILSQGKSHNRLRCYKQSTS